MGKCYLEPIAIFFIGLIITLPFYISDVYASAQISEVNIKGDNLVPNYIRQTDTLNVDVRVRDEGREIFPEQLKFNTQQFLSCEPEPNDFFHCFYILPVQAIAATTHPYNVLMFDNESNEIASRQGNFYVDNQRPDVSFTTDKTAYGDEMISLSYMVKDYAFSRGDTSKCSGIRRIELMEEERIFKEQDLTTTACSRSGTISFNSSEFASSSGSRKLCVVAYDQLEQKSEPFCESRMVSLEGAELEDVSALDINDEPLEWVGTGDTGFKLKADFSSSIAGVSQENIFANMRSINMAYRRKAPTTCRRHDDVLQCTWTGLIGHFKADETSYNIDFNVTDDAGNQDVLSYTLSVQIDDVGPDVQSIYTQSGPSAEVQYAALVNNTVYVNFLEAGSGVTESDVLLTAPNLGASMLPATNCTQSMCRWDNLGGSGSDGSEFSVVVEGMDLAGNAMTGARAKTIVMDAKAPELLGWTINSSSGFCPTYRDGMVINAVVREEVSGSVVLIADTHHFTGEDEQTVECEAIGSRIFNCTMEVGSLSEDSFRGEVDFSLRDAAGNSYDFSKEIELCQIATRSGTHVKIEYDRPASVPDKVSRKLASQTGQKVFIHTYLSGATILSKSFSCGDMVDNTYDPPYLMNEDADDPYMVLNIVGDNDSLEDNSLKIECNYSLMIQRGLTVYEEPDIVPVEVYVDLYELPLGEISDAIQDQIDKVDDEIDSLDKTIEDWEDINDLLGKFCAIAEALVVIDLILGVVRLVVAAITSWLKLGEAFWKLICQGSELIHGLRKYVYPTGAVASFGMFVKILCMLYSCKLCDTDNIAGVLTQSIPLGDAKYTINGQDGSANSHSISVTQADFDPYKSIHVAKSCYCIPAMIYNYNKKRQLECKYRNCLEMNAENGLPISVCARSHAESKCLYYEGAAWIATDGGFAEYWADKLLSLIIFVLLELMVFALIGGMMCDQPGSVPDQCSSSNKDFAFTKGTATCVVVSSALGLLEISWVTSGIGDMYAMYDGALTSEQDYCG
ncbi:hypothetical protein JW968_01970 [Candidatus Woesearchaeota archaeon]|nr:hypothetical protein [Candidatus Woesearchaeota archaeon]